MRKYKIETVENKVPTSIVCNVCGEEYVCGEDDIEIQEFLCIDFVGGYGSIFGDGRVVKADVCQYCLKDRLGECFDIKED